MFLIDTNVFLEILLDQDKKAICKHFLENNKDKIYISDFTLHSIGVILFRKKRKNLFIKFLSDIQPNIGILSLNFQYYKELIEFSDVLLLDFDDSYQYCIAYKNHLKIVTMDKDFIKATDSMVLFL